MLRINTGFSRESMLRIIFHRARGHRHVRLAICVAGLGCAPDRPCVDGDATATLAVRACMIHGQEVLMGCRIVSNGVGHW
eukprot:scaffold17742_cov80-Phaeocystis_antarctica.AAC.3